MAEAARPEELAEQIAVNPKLRARFINDPADAVKRVVPAKKFRFGVDGETVERRAAVLTSLAALAKKDPELNSSRHAETVIEQFFEDAIRNPQLSFLAIILMSAAVFLLGIGLVAAAFVIGFGGDGSTNDTVLASALGGSGVVGALGPVFILAKGGISLANANHVQIRLILSGFAVELGHLRALDLETPDQVNAVNSRVREAMETAVGLIQENVKPASRTGSDPNTPN